MYTKTNERKIKEGRGKGHGANYIPWLNTSEVSSLGTCSNPIDWKTGRTVELLSQGEAYFWYILRWDDSIEDIREQFPLDLETTLKICDEYGIKHPHNRNTYMTSDFYVTYKDGTERVFSVKNSKKELDKKRTKEKLAVEACYWKEYRHVDFQMVYKEDIDVDYCENIRFVCVYYDINNVHDRHSMLKHLIATKQVKVDLESGFIDMPSLMEKYEDLITERMKGYEQKKEHDRQRISYS